MAINRSMKILIADDQASVRVILRNILIQLGFKNIIEANDGTTALGALRTQHVDFVITDWSMPKMNGLSLIKEIRGDKELKHIPVLMITAEALRPNIIAAIKAGANNYIVKPFYARTIAEKIQRIFDDVPNKQEE